MTAVTTLRVVTRTYATVAATYDMYQSGPPGPDLYLHHSRPGRRYHWWLTEGDVPAGPALAKGTAWTRDGAVGKGLAAAHRPNLGRGAR